MRRLTRVASWVLLAAGGLLLLDAGLTLLWQEPVTAVIALVRRDGLDQRYLSFHALGLSSIDRRALHGLADPDRRIAFLARRDARAVPDGAAIGRIVIRRIGISDDVVQGAGPSALERGPGHYLETALPGMGGTVAIAGHRTTYLAPFRNLNRLRTGDRIVLEMPYGTFTYAVQSTRVVAPGAWWITRDVGYERLVLSACTPPFSAAQRLVVFARLIAEAPVRAVLAA